MYVSPDALWSGALSPLDPRYGAGGGVWKRNWIPDRVRLDHVIGVAQAKAGKGLSHQTRIAQRILENLEKLITFSSDKACNMSL